MEQYFFVHGNMESPSRVKIAFFFQVYVQIQEQYLFSNLNRAKEVDLGSIITLRMSMAKVSSFRFLFKHKSEKANTISSNRGKRKDLQIPSTNSKSMQKHNQMNNKIDSSILTRFQTKNETIL